MLQGRECTKPSVYQCANRQHQIALPLNADGQPLQAHPVPIDIGHHAQCPNHFRKLPDPDTYPGALTPTRDGYLVTWKTGFGFPNDCILLRAISATGTPTGPVDVVNKPPRGHYDLSVPGYTFAFDFNYPQVCSYAGGREVLVTWFVGEDGQALPSPPVRFAKYIGIYRQTYSSTGHLLGPDTRATRSIVGYVWYGYHNPRSYTYPVDEQTLVPAPSQDRCVVIATGINTVDAYAYDPRGRITQQDQLLGYRRRTTGSLPLDDIAVPAWADNTGTLFDFHFTGSVSPGWLTAYPLR